MLNILQPAWDVEERVNATINPNPKPSPAAFACEKEVTMRIKELFGAKGAFAEAIAIPENLSELQLHHIIRSIEKPGGKIFEREIRGLPTEFHARLVHDDALEADERRALMDEIRPLKDLYAFCEILVKALVNRELPQGLYIPVPQGLSKEPLYYRIAEQFISGGGLVAYGLVPATRSSWKKLDPIILFRGSLFYPAGLDAMSSYVTDMESWLGYSGYQSGKDSMARFMEALPEGKGVIVTGHSLGAAQAQWFTIDHAPKIKELITFNGPGLPKTAVKQFNEKLKRQRVPLKISLFRTSKDIIDLVGDHHLGWGLQDNRRVEVSMKKFIPQEGASFHPHQSRFLGRDATTYSIEEIKKEALEKLLDNRGRSSLEIVRKTFGGYVAAPVLWTTRAVARTLLGTRVKKIDS